MNYSRILQHLIFIGIDLKLIISEKCIFQRQKFQNVLLLREIYLFVKAVTLDELQYGHMIPILEYKITFIDCVPILRCVSNTISVSFSFINMQVGLAVKELAFRGFPQMPYILYSFHFRRYKNNEELLPK